MFLIIFLAVIAVLTLLLWRFSVWARRIEDDSSESFDRNARDPYGSKWLRTLLGRD
jgi:hypothetical protein